MVNGAHRIGQLTVIGLAAALTGGCGPAPVDVMDPQKPAPAASPGYDDRELAAALRENVRDGLVDYDHLKAHDAALQRYLDIVAAVGPRTLADGFRNRAERLAYYVNVYNAAVLRAVLHEGIPPTVHAASARRLEYDFRFKIDGRLRTLAEVRQAAEDEAGGDMRVQFYLCDAARGSPPLPEQPLRPDSLDQQLAKAARDAMDNPNLVRIDHENESLLVGLVISSRRAQFLDFYRRQTGGAGSMLSLLSLFANNVRREYLNTAIGYDERIIPFNRALNRWPSARAASVIP